MIIRILIAISTLSIFVIALTMWFDLIMENSFYLLMLPLMVSFFHLTTPPTFRLFGLYKYLSPMLLVNNPSKTRYELHNGTSFDYLMNMRRFKKYGVKAILLLDYLKGLLKIIQEIENGDLADNVIVHGSSYFFSKRTANRFGFGVQKASVSEKLNITFNYLDLVWMYSLANRKLSLPDLRQIKKVTITGNTLTENKLKIEQLVYRIEKTVANKSYT